MTNDFSNLGEDETSPEVVRAIATGHKTLRIPLYFDVNMESERYEISGSHESGAVTQQALSGGARLTGTNDGYFVESEQDIGAEERAMQPQRRHRFDLNVRQSERCTAEIYGIPDDEVFGVEIELLPEQYDLLLTLLAGEEGVSLRIVVIGITEDKLGMRGPLWLYRCLDYEDQDWNTKAYVVDNFEFETNRDLTETEPDPLQESEDQGIRIELEKIQSSQDSHWRGLWHVVSLWLGSIAIVVLSITQSIPLLECICLAICLLLYDVGRRLSDRLSALERKKTPRTN